MLKMLINFMEHIDNYKKQAKRAVLMEGAMKKFFEAFDRGMTNEEIIQDYASRGTQVPEAFVANARKQYEGYKKLKLELEISEKEFKNSARDIVNNPEEGDTGMEPVEGKQLASGIFNEKNTKDRNWYKENDVVDETSQEVEEEKAGNISVFFPNEDEVVDTTMDAMPTTPDFEDSEELETEIIIPEANTEIMTDEIITPISAVPQATPLKGPAGMSFYPATLEKLEQVDMPLFEANHGGIAALFKTRKPRQMVV